MTTTHTIPEMLENLSKTFDHEKKQQNFATQMSFDLIGMLKDQVDNRFMLHEEHMQTLSNVIHNIILSPSHQEQRERYEEERSYGEDEDGAISSYEEIRGR